MEKKSTFIFIAEPVIDLYVGDISKESLILFNFNPNDKGGWRGSNFNDKEYEAKEKFEKITESINKSSISTGGSLMNSVKTFSQLIEKTTVVIPYTITIADYRDMFKDYEMLVLKDKQSVYNTDILKVYVFVYNKERFLFSIDNGKLIFPTLTREEWKTKLNLDKRDSSNRIVIEGFPFYANKESFLNLIDISNKYALSVDFCLSNEFKLIDKENAKSVFKLLKDGSISQLIGNEGEFWQLIKTNLDDEILKDFTKKIKTTELIEDKEILFKYQDELFKKILSKFNKTTSIITRGKYTTLAVDSESSFEIPTVYLNNSKLIKNTNGAGDGFAAGFFAYLSKKNANNGKFIKGDLKEAIKYGHKIASNIIQIDGATFDTKIDLEKKLKNNNDYLSDYQPITMVTDIEKSKICIKKPQKYLTNNIKENDSSLNSYRAIY